MNKHNEEIEKRISGLENKLDSQWIFFCAITFLLTLLWCVQ